MGRDIYLINYPHVLNMIGGVIRIGTLSVPKKSVISLAKEALNLQARIQLDHINLIQFLKKQWDLVKLPLNVILNGRNQNMLLI